MIESILTSKKFGLSQKVIVKAIIAVLTIVAAVGLPQICHLAIGGNSGIRFLPMYLPVLMGALLLGSGWGVVIGVLSPVISYLITTAAGTPMPALARLPFMAFELAVFAVVAGAFSKLVMKNGLFAFVAVIVAEIVGRAAFVAAVAIFGKATPLSVSLVWSQIKIGWVGLVVNAVIVPLCAILVKTVCGGNEHE